MWLLLFACVQVGHWSECQQYAYDVADDEPVEGVPATAADGLLVAEGRWSASAAWEGGEPIALTGEVVRGGGSAVATSATLIAHESQQGFGLFEEHSYPLGYIPCDPGLSVPVDVSLTSDDGALAFTLDGLLRALAPFDSDVPVAWEVQGDVDPEDLGAYPGEPPAMLTLALQWFDGALALPSVSLWSEDEEGQYVQILETAP